VWHANRMEQYCMFCLVPVFYVKPKCITFFLHILFYSSLFGSTHLCRTKIYHLSYLLTPSIVYYMFQTWKRTNICLVLIYLSNVTFDCVIAPKNCLIHKSIISKTKKVAPRGIYDQDYELLK